MALSRSIPPLNTQVASMRKLLFPLTFLLGALPLCAPSAQAQERAPEFVMKIGTVAPARTPWADLLKRYKKKVKKSTNGRVKVKVYLGGTKGDELSLVRQVFKGTIQAAGVSTGAVASLVTDIDCLELPYLFDTAAEADAILDGPARPIIERMLSTKGLKLLMYSENGYRSFGTKFGFVRSPEDLKAKKMRAQENRVHVETYRALGASPVTISIGEVMSALQTGVVEGFDNTPLFTQAASLQQAIRYYTVSEHIYQPAFVIVNQKWFDGLPDDVRTALQESAGKLVAKGRKAVRALGPLLLQNFEAQDVKVLRLTEAQKAPFKKATRKVWAWWRNAAGADGKALFDAIMKAKGIAR